MKSDARAFADSLVAVLGQPDAIRVIESTTRLPPVCAFFFHQRPQAEILTVVTYGLSLATHPQWEAAKPELTLAVQSADEAWGLSLATVAERLRGVQAFAPGEIMRSDGEHADESEMTGFLLSQASPLAPFERAELPERQVVLRSAVPIHECEIELIERIGGEAFMAKAGDTVVDVTRSHLWE